MADISPTVVKLAPGVMRATWTDLTEDDTAIPLDPNLGGPSRPDKCVQVTGSFGGGDVSIEGSNDGTNYSTLSSPVGDPITFSAAGLVQIVENPAYIRPAVPTGTSASVEVIILYRSEKR